MRLRSSVSFGIGGNRRFETGERLLALAEREQRLAPAGERRCVSSVGGERAIEMRRGRPCPSGAAPT